MDGEDGDFCVLKEDCDPINQRDFGVIQVLFNTCSPNEPIKNFQTFVTRKMEKHRRLPLVFKFSDGNGRSLYLNFCKTLSFEPISFLLCDLKFNTPYHYSCILDFSLLKLKFKRRCSERKNFRTSLNLGPNSN